jgi:hypothetical protein
MLMNHRALIREWCARVGIPDREGLGRHRYARAAGLLTEGPHGDKAFPATSPDAGVLLLSFITAHSWRDVPRAVKEYGSLPLISVQCHDMIEEKNINPDTLDFHYRLEFSDGKTLLNVLAEMLELCGSQSIFRFSALSIHQSKTRPSGSLSIAVNTHDGELHRWGYTLIFEKPDLKQTENVIQVIYGLRGQDINTMADLLAPNVAAANRARMQAEHETGPSALTDEPIPFDNLPRATTPTATDSHPEASDKEKESQVSFESCGRSSGGSSLPPTESCDDRDDRPDRPSTCAA